MKGSSLGQINTMYEIFKIIITAVLTAGLTYWFSFKRERGEKKYKINKEILDKVYDPIIKIINQSAIPGEEYEGLGKLDIDAILDIIESNNLIVEPKIESFAWGFKEEISYNCYSSSNIMQDIYDEDGKFYKYINLRYNYIRKKLYFPYKRNCFFIPRNYRHFILWKDKNIRKLNRIIRKIKMN